MSEDWMKEAARVIAGIEAKQQAWLPENSIAAIIARHAPAHKDESGEAVRRELKRLEDGIGNRKMPRQNLMAFVRNIASALSVSGVSGATSSAENAQPSTSDLAGEKGAYVELGNRLDKLLNDYLALQGTDSYTRHALIIDEINRALWDEKVGIIRWFQAGAPMPAAPQAPAGVGMPTDGGSFGYWGNLTGHVYRLLEKARGNNAVAEQLLRHLHEHICQVRYKINGETWPEDRNVPPPPSFAPSPSNDEAVRKASGLKSDGAVS
jgi:hypothetical protein